VIDSIVQTQETVKDAIAWFSQFSNAVGIGIDTLTKWATGTSGWRPADLWLRTEYPDAASSVVSPNSLYGSMTVGGMAVKSWFFYEYPKAVISETHPKVLYFALKNQKYDRVNSSKEMVDFLSEKLGTFCKPRNDHEFDSTISCYVVLEFMLLSSSANRAKSWSCEHCENWQSLKKKEICLSCYWAHPEDYAHVAMRQVRRVDLAEQKSGAL